MVTKFAQLISNSNLPISRHFQASHKNGNPTASFWSTHAKIITYKIGESWVYIIFSPAWLITLLKNFLSKCRLIITIWYKSNFLGTILDFFKSRVSWYWCYIFVAAIYSPTITHSYRKHSDRWHIYFWPFLLLHPLHAVMT